MRNNEQVKAVISNLVACVRSGLATGTSAWHRSQAMREATHTWQQSGLACLQRGSDRPLSAQPLLDSTQATQMQAILHQSPRAFGLQAQPVES